MAQGKLSVLAEADAIADRVSQFARTLEKLYEGKAVTVVGILRGGAPFAIDLIRALSIPVYVEWMCLRSYTGMESDGKVLVLLKPEKRLIENRHIILVDDIIDLGLSAHTAVELLKSMKPASVTMVTVCDKACRTVEVSEFKAAMWKVAKGCFVVGYGMDFNGMFRDLSQLCFYTQDDNTLDAAKAQLNTLAPRKITVPVPDIIMPGQPAPLA